MNHKKISLFLLFFPLVFAVLGDPVQLFGKAPQSPSEVIEKFNETLLKAMKKGGELGYEGRYKLLKPVIEETFALPFMASVCAGRYWRTFDKKQQSRFLETYTDWTVATYAGRFNDYSGEKFVTEKTEAGRGSAQSALTVVSKLFHGKGDVTEFDYRLRDLGGSWRVVDIQISGVSQLALTRAQFVSVIKDKGYDGLLSMLKEKISRFSHGEEG